MSSYSYANFRIRIDSTINTQFYAFAHMDSFHIYIGRNKNKCFYLVIFLCVINMDNILSDIWK